MTSPRFHLLDVVTVASAADREPFGAVTQVRRYDDGSYRYVVAPLDPEDVATVFDESDLTPTGHRAKVSEFTMIGGFHYGEVVRIRNATALAEVAGKSGTVVGGAPKGETIAVSIADEVWSLLPTDLEATGQRVQRERPKRGSSLRVGRGGDLLGSDEYEVLEGVAEL
jgi:hypothetical protein